MKILEKQYEKGDLVYVLDTASIKGKCKKLSPPWKELGVVLDRLTPYIYKIKLQRVIFTANHDRLKTCRDRKIPVWLQKCQARMNRGENVLQPKDEKERKKYCICRGPDTEKTMIGCDFCKDWFHLTCVDPIPQEVEELRLVEMPQLSVSSTLEITYKKGREGVNVKLVKGYWFGSLVLMF